MGEVLGGVLAVLGILALGAVPVALSRWPRSVEDVVTQGWAVGRPGLAIRPCRGHPVVTILVWLMTLAVLALGASTLGRYPYAAGTCILVGLYLLYLLWARTTGRAGDGTLTMTPQGIHQLWAASEVFVPWTDVVGLVTTPEELIVQTRRPARIRRTLPLVGTRRAVQRPDAVAFPHGFLPPLPYQQMIEFYSTHLDAREELATDAPVQRARRLVRDVRATPRSGNR